MTRILDTAAVALGAAVFVAGCSTSDTTATTATTSAGTSVTGEITVFAAASLKTTFTALGEQLQKDNPGTTVRFSFAGSSDLVAQITAGAPADVFASADAANMTKAVDAGMVAGDPVDFASNTLTIVTPPGNPKNIASFVDLAKPGTAVVVCAPQVPCGNAAEKVETATGTVLRPVSEGSSVTDVLGKVTSGQADAGLVYVTDAKDAGDSVTAIAFPESDRAANIYPIAVVKESKNAATAQAFVDLVKGAQGRKVLSEAGFAAP